MVDFTYDGRTGASEGVLLVRSAGRDILPPIESHTIDMAGRHGVHYFGATYAARVVTIDIVLAESNLALLRERARNVAAWLHPRGVRSLTFSDEPDKFYNAVLSAHPTFEQLAAGGECSLSFLCPDPFVYSVDPQIVTMTTSPLAHTQLGTAPADPLIRIAGLSDGLPGRQIAIGVNTSVLTYVGPLLAGEVLEIDCAAKTITRVHGTVRTRAIHQVWTPVFAQLLPGANTVSLFTAGGATWSSVEINCRNRWY